VRGSALIKESIITCSKPVADVVECDFMALGPEVVCIPIGLGQELQDKCPDDAQAELGRRSPVIERGRNPHRAIQAAASTILAQIAAAPTCWASGLFNNLVT
jgi:hypothetical protein